MPDLNHLWQRFLLASSLIVGVLIGVATTVFGYSNLNSVNVHWSVLHIDGVPLWTVAVIPLALFLIAGTLYHWMDGLHHFTEHMRHRRRVHELEAEVASLRAHLDQVLEMPDHLTTQLPDRKATAASLPPADERITAPEPEAEPLPVTASAQAKITDVPAPRAANGSRRGDAPTPKKSRSTQRKRATLEVAGTLQPTEQSGSEPQGIAVDGKVGDPKDGREPAA